MPFPFSKARCALRWGFYRSVSFHELVGQALSPGAFACQLDGTGPLYGGTRGDSRVKGGALRRAFMQ
jgi:hypothetical protein